MYPRPVEMSFLEYVSRRRHEAWEIGREEEGMKHGEDWKDWEGLGARKVM